MLGKFEGLIEKASEMGLKAYFVNAGDIPVENRIALKFTYRTRHDNTTTAKLIIFNLDFHFFW